MSAVEVGRVQESPFSFELHPTIAPPSGEQIRSNRFTANELAVADEDANGSASAATRRARTASGSCWTRGTLHAGVARRREHVHRQRDDLRYGHRARTPKTGHPNHDQVSPVLYEASRHSGKTVIRANMSGESGQSFTIELYAQRTCPTDSISLGQGLQSLGTEKLDMGGQRTMTSSSPSRAPPRPP